MTSRTPVATLVLAAVSILPTACRSAAPMPHTHHTIDYIEFTVADMAESKRFYGEAFDWRFTDYGPTYAGIQRADGDGEVGGFTTEGEVKPGGALVVLYSSDLDATARAVVAAGGTIVTAPFDFPGGRRFHFTDLSGNELAVWAEASAPAE